MMGILTATSECCESSKLFTFHLHQDLLLAKRHGWDGYVALSDDTTKELRWWVRNLPSFPAKPILAAVPKLPALIRTDASGSGWGAVLYVQGQQHSLSQGKWTETEAQQSNNVREMSAVVQALRAFLPVVATPGRTHSPRAVRQHDNSGNCSQDGQFAFPYPQPASLSGSLVKETLFNNCGPMPHPGGSQLYCGRTEPQDLHPGGRTSEPRCFSGNIRAVRSLGDRPVCIRGNSSAANLLLLGNPTSSVEDRCSIFSIGHSDRPVGKPALLSTGQMLSEGVNIL